MKKGFTLAEVLITLAVIGVVAALTIPALVHKYQQKQMYTQFMKVYNTLSNAAQLSIDDNGNISNWDYSEPNNIFDKYFSEYLKVINTKPLPDYDLHILSGTTVASLSAAVIGGSEGTNSDDMYYFADGSSCAISVAIDEYGIGLICDTNGDKAPNTLGRDIFVFIIEIRDNKFKPQYETGENNDACSVNGDGAEGGLKGLGCADRLLKEGKMNY